MITPDLCMSCMQPLNGYDVCAHCGWQKTDEQSDPCHLPMGTVLSDRYIIGKSLGAGGFGITYVAWDDTLKQKIAVKEYYPAGFASRIPGQTEVVVFSGSKKEQYFGGLQRFLAEARNMAKFSSDPNIVNVIDFFEANNTAYIAMEYLDGITLKEYLKKCGGSLPLDVATQIIKPVSDALSHMHAQGIIHRDVSPDNIMITSSNVIKLIDFGAARLSLGEREETLSVMLKPGFAPPEQYRSKSRQGPFTDVYALGATFYRMITGKMPPESTDRMLEDDLALPSSIDPLIPESVDRAVLRAMALDFNVRFKSTDEFVKALTSGESVQYPEEVVRRHKTRNILLVIAAALAAVAACVALFIITRDKNNIKAETLSVWIPQSQGEDNLYEELVRGAQDAVTLEYPQITFEVTAIPAAEYRARLLEAAASGQMPDLYTLSLYDESSINGDTVDTAERLIDEGTLLGCAIPVGEAVADISGDLGDYAFLPEYAANAENRCMPTSFRMPLMFVNHSNESGVEDAKLDACSSIADLDAYITGELGGTWRISSRAADCLYDDCSDDERALIAAHTLSDGETAGYEPAQDTVFIGLSTDLKWASRKATIRMRCVPGHEYVCELTGMWCVSANESDNRVRASKLLLVKLLNASVQEGISPNTKCFPLNKRQCENLMGISGITLGAGGANETPAQFLGKAKALGI